jgi:uncharacterized DUF497 family protein
VVINELEWDDENIEHIARHKVSPKEVEDVCFGLHISEKSGGSRYVLSGQSGEGRYLNVVVERISKGLFRPITAYQMNEGQKARYRKRVDK